MKKYLTTVAAAMLLTGSAHAGPEIYVRMIVGMEVCKLDKTPQFA